MGDRKGIKKNSPIHLVRVEKYKKKMTGKKMEESYSREEKRRRKKMK